METVTASKSGKKQTTAFCSEIYRGRLGSCLEYVVDHIAFEEWLNQNCRKNGIFVNK